MFSIDSNNNVSRYDSPRPARDLTRFGSQRDLVALASKWPAARLVAIWNKLPDVTRVRRFTDRKTGVGRIWKEIQNSHRASTATSPPEGTKAERVIARLQEPSGATLEALMILTGWQSHSVRGFLSGQLSKKRGLRIQSFKRDGERVYRIG
jgi:hypothetical protein